MPTILPSLGTVIHTAGLVYDESSKDDGEDDPAYDMHKDRNISSKVWNGGRLTIKPYAEEIVPEVIS